MNIRHVVITGRNQVELQETQLDIQNLEAHDILIETESTFISAGTELAIYTAKTDKVYQPGAWCEYPFVAGYANIGTVKSVGHEVTRFKVGQRVYTQGEHASMVLCNEKRVILPVPDEMESSVAVATCLATIAATSVKVSEVPQNGWVVVFGLGMIGNLAAQCFQILGCKVIGIDPVASRRKLAEHCGVQYTAGGSEEEVSSYIEQVTNGKRCDISIDAVGHSAVILQAVKSTANFGQVVLLGTPRTPYEMNATSLLAEIHLRWLTLRGALNFLNPERVIGIQEMIFDWVQCGKMNIKPLISHTMNPDQIKEAYEGLLHQPEQYIGVVLNWNTRGDLK